ncbi:hypothetical protein PPL_00005 [Heterostelium album PN500]|uniref:Uncharacterized protein n=1 Tax=Heterostelium pallidum (strain ATCC 26659 / Pp 5 / PN500) TaxID=670386 RepID=D3BVK4_HETP5|nr:hypothetical protein PPL_00005 [Heterostelium album PN500]EFA74507.1 hypothetical protein PPL_00005 [Heterostelium album PN500]|eukprot:XP_020426641.1 hypothetical protein PPL_00005 [Heterostelium album PN500]
MKLFQDSTNLLFHLHNIIQSFYLKNINNLNNKENLNSIDSKDIYNQSDQFSNFTILKQLKVFIKEYRESEIKTAIMIFLKFQNNITSGSGGASLREYGDKSKHSTICSTNREAAKESVDKTRFVIGVGSGNLTHIQRMKGVKYSPATERITESLQRYSFDYKHQFPTSSIHLRFLVQTSIN